MNERGGLGDRGIIPGSAGGAWILVDKPAGMTSHDVVAAVRRITGERRAGHAGALDPGATGLLVIALGSATKQLAAGLSGRKTYLAAARFGMASPTYDLDSKSSFMVEAKPVTESELREHLDRIAARTSQIPPLMSALKLKGQPLYKVARRGWWLGREARPVEPMEIELTEFDETHQETRFRVSAGGGTYVRSIVRDLGIGLGEPAVLTGLRRLAAEPYTLEQAVSLAGLEDAWRAYQLEQNDSSGAITEPGPAA